MEGLYKRGATFSDIARKYHVLFQNSEVNLYMKMGRHIKKKHGEKRIREEMSISPDGEITFAEYEKKLLRAAMMDDDMFTGKKISHAAVIAAKRASIEEAKAKTQESALKFAMVRFLRGEGAHLPDGTTELIESNTE